ncbi:MAG: MFS transporter [Alphaproteobacteria bacterium]|nr:MFS transporter [Alphaproteobacteria bacterium]
MKSNIDSIKKPLYFRILPATVVGNALEFFDFTIYAIFAATIGKIFFPLESSTASLMASWGTFAVGFIMRPLGAIIFGYLGDKYGRKFSLSGTVLLTGFPTLCIGLLPGYEEIGILAPMILILCRLLQGLCTGGEYNGAAIFALEHFGKLKPGTIGGIITSSCVIGALLATFSGFLISNYGEEWMWRLPFIFGAFISFIGFIIRYFINETPEFSALKQTHKSFSLRFSTLYNSYLSSSLLSFLVGSLNGALSYTLFGFLNLYMAKYLGLEAALAMKYNLVGLSFFMFFCPLAGYGLDRWGGEKAMQIASCAVLGGAIPVFFLLQTLNPVFILLGQALLGILTAGIAGAGHGFMQKLFPTHVRYRGISVNFCLGMALCGGTAPMLLTYLIEVHHFNLYVPALYLMCVSFVFLMVLMTFSRKLYGEQLTRGSGASYESL